MACGVQAAQAAHAAFQFAHEHPEITRSWHEVSQYLILLSVPTEDALDVLLTEAVTAGIPYSNFYEPDICDEQGNAELTAIALAPCEETRRLCANLPLAFKEVALA